MAVIIPLHRPGTAPAPVAVGLTQPPPLAVYVHVPWCVRKCPYCDFNSHALRNDAARAMPRLDADVEQRYLDALAADLEHALPAVWGRRVNSVFIGGGTPSLLSGAGVDRLLTTLRALLQLDPLAEITLEANPGSLEAGRFADFRAAGVNRLSIGVQSFDDRMLHSLGRIHDGATAQAAIDTALDLFEQVNLDLMYALPEQDLDGALADLERALASGAQHLSCYHLTLEPNTPFHHAPPPLPDADLAADMQDAIEARLTSAGYVHYETSAFTRRGMQCRHNLNYWTFGDYLGIGAGAHSKLTHHTGVERSMRHKHPEHYLDGAARGDFIASHNIISTDDLPFEFMMNALRLIDGVPARLFQERTGLDLMMIRDELQLACARGLLDPDPAVLCPTEQGRRFLNDLLTIFLRR